MGFFSGILKDVGGLFGVGGDAGIGNYYDRKMLKKEDKYTKERMELQAEIGKRDAPFYSRLGVKSSLAAGTGMLDAIMDRGATLQEAIGAPPGGASSGGSSGVSIGNASANQSVRSELASMQFQAQQADLERQNRVDVAKVQAGVGHESNALTQARDAVQAEVQRGRLSLDREMWETQKWRKEKSWAIYEIMLKMGPDNVVSALIVNQFERVTGKSPLSPDGKPLSRQEFTDLLSTALAAKSHLGREFSAIFAGLLGDAVDLSPGTGSSFISRGEVVERPAPAPIRRPGAVEPPSSWQKFKTDIWRALTEGRSN